MTSKDNVDSLVRKILLGEWPEKVDAADELARIASPEVVDRLSILLSNSDARIRNASALALREIGNSAAVRPLLDAIQLRDNHQNRSTLVYALETLDCSRHFIDIFRLALSSKFDVQMSALAILDEQVFCVSADDISKASALLKSADKERVAYDWLVEYILELKCVQ